MEPNEIDQLGKDLMLQFCNRNAQYDAWIASNSSVYGECVRIARRIEDLNLAPLVFFDPHALVDKLDPPECKDLHYNMMLWCFKSKQWLTYYGQSVYLTEKYFNDKHLLLNVEDKQPQGFWQRLLHMVGIQ